MAAEFYGIPKSTLRNKVSGYRPMTIKKVPELTLSLELENHIVKWIVHMTHISYGQTQSNILDKVQELVMKLKIPTSFSDRRPSHKWYQLFMERQPDLHAKIANILSQERCQVFMTTCYIGSVNWTSICRK